MSGIRIAGSVVVIAGASSGIGRAAAIAFARQGANLVLGARRVELLKDVAGQCHAAARKAGYRRTRAVAVSVDVGDAAQLQNLVAVAMKRFGHIDVWINNAGVGAVGAFTDVPMAAHDQTVRTNLLGTMHGAYAVVPVFLRQRRGILINTGSVGSFVPAPFAAAYSASKFGLRGFTEALRAELQPSPDIHVCDIYPSFVDTPGVQHAGNYTGRYLKPPPMILAPERVADAMVQLARAPRDATTIGVPAGLARLGYALLPGLSRAIGRWAMQRYFAQAPRIAMGPGNVFTPVPQGRGTDGGWRTSRPKAGLIASGLASVTGIAIAAVLMARED